MRKRNNPETDEYTVRMDDGADVIPVVAGLLVSVAGLGFLGYRLAGNWGALTGAVAGLVLGIVYNNLMAQLAKWGSLAALAALAIYGTITIIA